MHECAEAVQDVHVGRYLHQVCVAIEQASRPFWPTVVIVIAAVVIVIAGIGLVMLSRRIDDDDEPKHRTVKQTQKLLDELAERLKVIDNLIDQPKHPRKADLVLQRAKIANVIYELELELELKKAYAKAGIPPLR